ncbi:hypothetical protein MKX54_11790 [Alkalihalobacillus sp. FSL R5-0424]
MFKNKSMILVLSLLGIGGGIFIHQSANSEVSELALLEQELKEGEREDRAQNIADSEKEPDWRKLKTAEIKAMIRNGESVAGLNEARDDDDWWREELANDISNLHISFNNMFWEWEGTIGFDEQDAVYLDGIKENLLTFSEKTEGHKMNKDVVNAASAVEKAFETEDIKGLEIAHTIIHDLDIFYNGYKVNQEKPSADSFDDTPFLVTHYNNDDTSEVDEYVRNSH